MIGKIANALAREVVDYSGNTLGGHAVAFTHANGIVRSTLEQKSFAS